jgi:hypothetical protein
VAFLTVFFPNLVLYLLFQYRTISKIKDGKKSIMWYYRIFWLIIQRKLAGGMIGAIRQVGQGSTPIVHQSSDQTNLSNSRTRPWVSELSTISHRFLKFVRILKYYSHLVSFITHPTESSFAPCYPSNRTLTSYLNRALVPKQNSP